MGNFAKYPHRLFCLDCGSEIIKRQVHSGRRRRPWKVKVVFISWLYRYTGTQGCNVGISTVTDDSMNRGLSTVAEGGGESFPNRYNRPFRWHCFGSTYHTGLKSAAHDIILTLTKKTENMDENMDETCPWLPAPCRDSSLSVTSSIAAILTFSWVKLLTIYFIWTSIRTSKSDYSKCRDDYASIRQQHQELSEQVNQLVQRVGPEIIVDAEVLQEEGLV